MSLPVDRVYPVLEAIELVGYVKCLVTLGSLQPFLQIFISPSWTTIMYMLEYSMLIFIGV